MYYSCTSGVLCVDLTIKLGSSKVWGPGGGGESGSVRRSGGLHPVLPGHVETWAPTGIIDDRRLVVPVLAVGHRRQVYR